MQKDFSKKLWTTEYISLNILIIFIFLSISTINSTISVFIVEELKGSPTQVGLISSLMIISALVFRPISGYLIDRFGRRLTITLAIILAVIGNLSLIFVSNLTGLGFVRLLMGIPFSLTTTGSSALRADLIPEERRAEGFNYSEIITLTTALVIGPNIGILILDRFSFDILFLYAALFGISALSVFFLMKFEDIKDHKRKLNFNSFFERRVVWFSILLGLIFFGWPGLLTYGPLYAIELGLTNSSMFLLSFGIGLLLSRFISKVFINRDRPKITNLIPLFLILIGYMSIGFIRKEIGFLIGGCFLGIGYSLAFTIYQAMAFDLVEPESRGACSGTLIIGQDIGATIGLYTYGYMAEVFGSYSASYSLVAVVMILPIILFFFIIAPDYSRKLLAIRKNQ